MQTKRKLSRLKGFYQKIPEKFYEKTAFILLCMMFGVIIFSGALKFAALFSNITVIIYVSKYYYLVGFIVLLFSILYLSSRICLNGWKNISIILNKEQWLVMLAFLLIWTFFSTMNAKNVELAFNGYYWRMDGFRSYLIYAGMFLCGRIISKTKYKQYIIVILVVVATIQDSLIFIKYFTGKGIYAGAFFNENHCGYFLTMAIMALLGLLSLEKKKPRKVVWIVLYIINNISLMLNNTFGSYLAVLFGILFGLIISYKKTRVMLKGILLGAVLFILTSFCMDLLTHNVSNNFKITTKDTNNILDTSQDANSAGSGRWLLWKGALKYSFEKPVLGYGPENLQARYMKDNIYFERPHNEYLQYAAYFGYPGLLFYLAALASLFSYYCIRRKSNTEIATTCLMVVFGYCVSAFFGLTMFYTVSFFFMFLGMISKRNDAFE